MEIIMTIHLHTEKQVIISNNDSMIIPRIDEHVHNHNNEKERVVDVEYKYRKEDVLQIDVITELEKNKI